jgi:hypothetical protein
MLSTEGAVGHCPGECGCGVTALFCCLWREEKQRPHELQQRTEKKQGLQRYPGKVTPQAPAPQGAVLMASVSVPGVHSWGNRHSLSVLGALGLSPCHGGGLRAPFFCGHALAGRAGHRTPHVWISTVFLRPVRPHVPPISRFLIRPPPGAPLRPLPWGGRASVSRHDGASSDAVDTPVGKDLHAAVLCAKEERGCTLERDNA